MIYPRDTDEYRDNLRCRLLIKQHGIEQARNIMWVENTLARFEKKPPYQRWHDDELDDLQACRDILFRIEWDNLWKDFKFDSDQPRAPRGTPGGGQWVDDGKPNEQPNDKPNNGPGDKPPRVQLPKPKPKPPKPADRNPDAIHPVYPVETALAVVSGAQALRVARVLTVRAAASAAGTVSRYRVRAKIHKAARAVEKYLDDDLQKVIKNKNGDHVFMNKKGDKKVRFDINKPGKKNGQPIKPHFQIEKGVWDSKKRKYDWPDAGSEHRYYFNE